MRVWRGCSSFTCKLRRAPAVRGAKRKHPTLLIVSAAGIAVCDATGKRQPSTLAQYSLREVLSWRTLKNGAFAFTAQQDGGAGIVAGALPIRHAPYGTRRAPPPHAAALALPPQRGPPAV